MAIGKAEKAAYNDEIKDIKKDVDAINKEIKELMVKNMKMFNIEGYFNIEIAVLLMQLIRKYVKINDVSLDMLGIKSDTNLNNARKEFYKVLQMMEETVGRDLDRSLKENDEYLVKIEKLTPQQVLNLVRKMDELFHEIRSKVGESSKWKWSFVELQARVAIIVKNITSFSDIGKYRDPRTEFFYERRDLMEMGKACLTEAAKQYRTKYEMAGKAREDLKKSIDLLSALRKIHVIFGEDEEATKLKNTIDANKQALKSEDNSAEEKKKLKK